MDLQGTYYNKLLKLLHEMDIRAIERDIPIRLIALTFLCKTNCFFVGPRGVGKSHLIENTGDSIEGSKKLWQLLLKKSTKPEELFGRTYQDDEGKWCINKKNSILEAHNVFLDEMFKAEGKTLSGLLELLVDRCYTFGDGVKTKTDIIAFFGASNEYPTDRFMLPFVDRFLLWDMIEPIKDVNNRIKYYKGEFERSLISEKFLSISDLDTIGIESQKIVFPDELYSKYTDITMSFIKADIKTSDRKYLKIIEIIKVMAYMNNRTQVNESDLFILLNSAWHNDQEKIKVHDNLMKHMFSTRDKVKTEISYVEKVIEEHDSIYRASYFKLINHMQHFNNVEGEDEFLSSINELKTLIKHYEWIKDTLNSKIMARYRANMKLAAEVSGNIFTKDMEEPIFDMGMIKNTLRSDLKLKKKIREIEIWVGQNENFFAYNIKKKRKLDAS